MHDRIRETFRDVIDSDEFVTETARFRAADGSWVWFESRVSNLTGPGRRQALPVVPLSKRLTPSVPAGVP
ncbi:hypothetical protein BRC65_07055 [Halobacteriales archaeon QH_2_65_14]|nr:MAG: hypothetical protein BRC65_07055 [Halobacteriales archaeon QH_2_65_14]